MINKVQYIDVNMIKYKVKSNYSDVKKRFYKLREEVFRARIKKERGTNKNKGD